MEVCLARIKASGNVMELFTYTANSFHIQRKTTALEFYIRTTVLVYVDFKINNTLMNEQLLVAKRFISTSDFISFGNSVLVSFISKLSKNPVVHDARVRWYVPIKFGIQDSKSKQANMFLTIRMKYTFKTLIMWRMYKNNEHTDRIF